MTAQGGGVKHGGGGAAPRVLNVARKGSGKDVTVAMKDVKKDVTAAMRDVKSSPHRAEAQTLIDSVKRDGLAESLGGSPHKGALDMLQNGQKGARTDPLARGREGSQPDETARDRKARNLIAARDFLADS